MAYKTKINNPTLFPELEITNSEDWKLTQFSANGFYKDNARIELENKYWPITIVTDKFNRQTVSYQLSKKDRLHRWLKYKEGFSSQLVKILLNEFNIKEGDTVLDPFMGSGTTGLVCCLNGINSVGFDILPMSILSINAKTALYDYNIAELKQILNDIITIEVPQNYNNFTPYVSITKGAYPQTEDKAIAYFTDFFEKSNYSDISKNLIKLCILNSLEKISWTIKSGQYLSWDHRSPKIIEINNQRIKAGKKPFVNKNDKGKLPTLKESLKLEFSQMLDDIIDLQKKNTRFKAKCNYIEGSVLFEITNIASNSIDAVITSPPYCNRYDYTRTYALELAYLGKNEEDFKKLRQALLSCTVESKSKVGLLKEHYIKIGRFEEFKRILEIVRSNNALKEINGALEARNANGEINNKGILKMVDGYFTELTFLFAELYRVLKSGSQVAFVNDNVRYAGEVIPVDFLSTSLAEAIGFIPIKVYTLKQQKGNSSQQMAKYGRVAIRKSITIWQKR